MMNLSKAEVRSKAKDISWVIIYRICGEISVSRSIGDAVYKNFVPGKRVDEPFLWPANHNQVSIVLQIKKRPMNVTMKVFMADLVIPTPECRLLTLSPNVEFLVIASDGLWDVMTHEEVVTKVK